MFKSIFVPVDNSDYSNRAIELAVSMGARLGAKLIGSHVYAASMHDYRFKQMEFTLPEEYLQEQELERQRKIHDSLITMGLELVSDSYLDEMERLCKTQNLEFERKMMDGKHYVEIIGDIEKSQYDLTIIGAQGIGKVKDSQLGSVCAQVARHVNRDVWVIRDTRPSARRETESDTILVAVDGSPQSFGGLSTAIEMARIFDKKIELISVYDPYLHYSVFNGIVKVLSEKAKKVFRFEEQNQLHEEIIDTGLAQIYQSHLNVAETIAESKGVKVEKTLLDGKAFQKILDHVRKIQPWLLVMGRLGVHSPPDTPGLGNATENLLRLCPCDMLLNSRAEVPQLDLKAEESIIWTDEAKERMKKVPSFVRGIARTGILRMAIEQGHSVVTNSLITEAMDKFMPKYTSRVTEELAETLAFDMTRSRDVAMCRHCGVSAKEPDPVRCSVCGSQNFEIITADMVDKISASEGGVEEEATFDGRKLKWTREARLELRSIEDKYQMRRVKARVEKSARIKRLDTISLDQVRLIIKDELGSLPITARAEKALVEGARAPVTAEAELPIIGIDEGGIELRSSQRWDQPAINRLLRVPAGFMRDRTQKRIEDLAMDRNAPVVGLGLVEEGLELGRKMMEELLNNVDNLESLAAAMASQPATGSPAASLPTAGLPTAGSVAATAATAVHATSGHASTAPAGVCPFQAAQMKKQESESTGKRALNEVGSIHYPVNKPRVAEKV